MRKVWSWGCLAATVLMFGCSSPHLAISDTAATVPAGSSKSFQALAQDSDGQILWTLSGPGSLDLTSGPQVTYFAPATYDPAGQHSAVVKAQLTDAPDEVRSIAITITQPSSSVGGIPGLVSNVTVTYDERDIPTISCIKTADCYAVLGYVQARDRLFEMDFFRRSARGTLSELLGEPAISQDESIRTVFTAQSGAPVPDELTAHVLSDPSVKTILDAYTAGVNAWLAKVHADPTLLPDAYSQLQFQITNSASDLPDWTAVDTVAIGRLLQFELSEDIEKEADYGLWARKFQTNLVAIGVWIQARSPVESFTLAGTGAPNAPSILSAPADLSHLRTAGPALSGAKTFAQPLHVLRAALGGPAGSNNWVVDGAHSATGQAMLANDPHLSLNYPSNFHLAHLIGTEDGLNVMGAVFPGTPVVVIGRGTHVAWGATVVGYDVTDLYVEQVTFDPSTGLPVKAKRGSATVDIKMVPQSINVRGSTPDAFAVFVVPDHGPIISIDPVNKTAITARWTGQETATDDIRAYYRLNTLATAVADAVQSLDGDPKPDGGTYTGWFTGAQNFVLADDQGNIAYDPHACVPVRAYATSMAVYPLPVVPVPGTGGFEWPTDGNGNLLCVPNDKLPKAIGSNKGYLATANADPLGVSHDNDPYANNPGNVPYLSFEWDDLGFRIQRIQNYLDAKTANGGKVSLDDVHALQADHYENAAAPFIGVFTQVDEIKNASDPDVVAARNMLVGWASTAKPLDCPTGLASGSVDPVVAANDPDPVNSQNSAACLLFHTFLRRVNDRVFSDEEKAAGIGPHPGQEVRALLSLLSGAVPNPGNALCSDVDTTGAKVTDHTCNQQVIDALGWAYNRLRTTYGDVKNWRWGRVHTLTFSFIIPGYPLIDSVWQPGPFARPGGAWTVDVGNPAGGSSNNLAFPYFSGGNVRWAAVMDGTLANTTMQLPGVEHGSFDPSKPGMLGDWLTNTYFNFPFQKNDSDGAAVRNETFTP